MKNLCTAADRISVLPEPIIHHILCFLPTKDLKVTSSLSKSWHQICSSFPYLDFHDSPFERSTDKHLNYIDKTLRRFHKYNNLNLQIQRLSIPITLRGSPSDSDQIDHLDSWIDLVLQHGVVEFKLNITCPLELLYIGRHHYDLPRHVFADKSIKVAEFMGISLLNSFPNKEISSSSSCNLLKKLFLDHVRLDELTLSCMLSSCPLLEELSMFLSVGITRIRISNLNKLTTLVIFQFDGTIEIDLPSLQSLWIGGSKIRLLECPQLTDLHLENVVLELQLQGILSRLSFLRSLRLSNVRSLTKVKVSSDALKMLTISYCNDLLELDINALNLISVTYNGDFAPLTSMSLHNATGVRWNASTGYHGSQNPHTVIDFLVELKNFVSKARHFEKLSLHFKGIDQTFNNKELIERVVDQPPVSIIDLLELRINQVSISCLLELFEGVVRSCHPRTLSMQLFDLDGMRINRLGDVQEIINKIIFHGDCELCSSWIHRLEDVRYVDKDGTEDQLCMEGRVGKPYMSSSYSEIKFIFKW